MYWSTLMNQKIISQKSKKSIFFTNDIRTLSGKMLQMEKNGISILKRVLVTQSISDGLLGYDSLPNDQMDAMFFDAAFSIHMITMKFSLDVIYLDHNLKITTIAPDRQPAASFKDAPEESFAKPMEGSRYAVELPAGSIAAYDLNVGDKIDFLLTTTEKS
jgi:uncharacterized membrane protein (UPF0127 family)